jgi:hypothetical protein
LAGEIFSLIRMPLIAFLGGFLVVGGWIWAPTISSLMAGLLSGTPNVSLFADANRLGRPETAPVVRKCIAGVMDLGPDAKMEPSAAYYILKAGSMQANVSAMLGKSDGWEGQQTLMMVSKWGQLADCIYAQDDRALCDADNRAAAVEATAKFFGYAKQIESPKLKSAISAGDAREIEVFSDRLLNFLRNHRSYGTLVAADFGSFAPPEIMQVMRGEKATRDICKR